MHDILNFAVNKRFMITAAHISQFSSRFFPLLSWKSCIKVDGWGRGAVGAFGNKRRINPLRAIEKFKVIMGSMPRPLAANRAKLLPADWAQVETDPWQSIEGP